MHALRRSELTRALAIAILYFVIAWLSLVRDPGHIAVIWPPAGFALAVLLLVRRQSWPLMLPCMLLAVGLAHVAHGSSSSISLAFALTNILEACAAAWLVVRIAGAPRGIRRLREVSGLATAAIVSAALAGLMGAGVAAVGLGAPYWEAWRVWWISDGIGMLSVGSVILVIAPGRSAMPDLTSIGRRAEAVALLATLVGVTFLAFGIAPISALFFFRAYMVFPLLLWAAIRFESFGAAVAVAVLAALSAPLTLSGLGTFAEFSPLMIERLLALQVYLGMASLAALTAAAGFNERRHAESALRASLLYNRSLFEASLDQLGAIDTAGKVTDVNRATELLLGQTRSELIGTDFAQYFTEPETARTALMDVLAKGHVSNFPLTVRNASGGRTEVLYTANVLRDENGHVTGVFGAARDVTEQRRAEREAETIREVTQLALSTTSVDEFTRELPRVLSRRFGVPIVELATYDTARDEMVFGPSVGIPATSPPQHIPADETLCGLAMRSREVVVELNVMDRPEPRFAALKDLGVRACICAPIIELGGRVLGTIALADTQVRPELAQVRQPLQTIASNVAEVLERARIQAALRRSEERYRLLAENVGDVIWVLDLGTMRFSYVSPSVQKLRGYTAEEAMARNVSETLMPNSLQRIQSIVPERLARARAGMQDVYVDEVEQSRKDGSTVWVESTTHYTLNHETGRWEAYGVSRDITAHRVAEEALRESRSRFDDVVSSQPAGIYRIHVKSSGDWRSESDPIFSYDFVSDRFCELLGCTRDEILANPYLTIQRVHPDDRDDCIAVNVQAGVTRQAFMWEGRMILNGATRWMHFESQPRVLSDGDTLWTGVLFDVTKQQQAVEEKKKLEAQYRQLQRAESLGRMAGAVAHHFNNLLGAVMGNIELSMAGQPNSTEGLELLNDAMEAARQAADVSGQMLTYVGASFAVRDNIDLAAACARALPALRAATPKTGALDTALPSPGPTVRANEHELQQVLINLVTNAWEAIGRQRGTVQVAVTTVDAANIAPSNRFPIDWNPSDAAYACLTVTDTGAGITPTDVEQLFDPFFSSKFTGRGLGLAVALGIVRSHGGAIAVDSELGRGSVFQIFLPLST